MVTPSTTVRRRPSQHYTRNNDSLPSIHWLFRSNIPRRRGSFLPTDVHKRNFFGMGEILSVLSNPAETVRSLTESKRLLEEARREIAEHNERSQIRPKHTFSRLPGFFPRKAEMQAIERALEGEPSFTILFGASSTGKTALLREVLSRDQYHVLHFDLRIAGFADISSLYMSFSRQMQLYFEEIANKMPGYEEFQREAWSFKHDRKDVERRIVEASEDGKFQAVKTSDIARLMELFQSSLLKYWEFRPNEDTMDDPSPSRRQEFSEDTERTRISSTAPTPIPPPIPPRTKSKWPFRWGKSRHHHHEDPFLDKGKQKPPVKKMPVIFFDEAHKLPGLIQSTEVMKCLLDTMLVLTKQDRLCHVVHLTSDPFYQTWLRQLNVMQHCKTVTIGDCSKDEMKQYFREQLLPRVPERLRSALNFEVLYDAFGGKFAHWNDYIGDYINSGGRLDIKQSSHFLQAHSLLNLHIIHSSQSSSGAQEAANTAQVANGSNPETLHPSLGPAGFKVYSPMTGPMSPTGLIGAAEDDRQNTLVAGIYCAEFTAMQLLKVMSRLTQPDTDYIPYFLLCREIGVRAVDGMVKGRLLDLRWSETVTREGSEEGTSVRVRSGVSLPVPGLSQPLPAHVVGGMAGAGASGSAVGIGHSATAVDELDEVMVPIAVSEREYSTGPPPPPLLGPRDIYEEAMEVVGPKLVPTTPIMRFAMRDVVQEYEDEGSVSEYASLSDVDEY